MNNLSVSDLGRREETLVATKEAVEMLFPLFCRFPAPLAHTMRVMVQIALFAILRKELILIKIGVPDRIGGA